MPTRIYEVNGIITTITVKIKTIYILGIKVRCIVGRNKSTPFGRVVSCVKVIPTGFSVIVITTVFNGVIQ